jgi:hypothetical protein
MEPITAEQAAEAAKGLTFEKVWAALMETRQRMEESSKRTEKALEESNKRMEESNKRTDKILTELSRNIGGVSNSVGQISEAMMSAELWKKFSDLGYSVTRQNSNVKIRDGKQVLAEIDLFIENGDCCILVEIKTKLTSDDVDKHIGRIGVVRSYLDRRGDSRKLLGAVAGAAVSESVRDYAQSNGLFVVIQTGDSIAIAEAPQGFMAMEW